VRTTCSVWLGRPQRPLDQVPGRVQRGLHRLPQRVHRLAQHAAGRGQVVQRLPGHAHGAVHHPARLQRGVRHAAHRAHRAVKGAGELRHDLGVVVDEGQRALDHLRHVVEIDQQQRLRVHAADPQAHLADGHVGAGLHVHQVGHARVQRQPRLQVVHLQRDALHAQVGHQQHHVVARVLRGRPGLPAVAHAEGARLG